MKTLTTVLVIFIISGCTNVDSPDPRLEGTWISDKEKTLNAIGRDSTLSGKQLKHIEKILGDLTFIFKGNETAVIFAKSPNIKPEYEKFDVISSDEKSVSIRTSKNAEATYYFEGKCFYLTYYDKWQYKEYFCKQ